MSCWLFLKLPLLALCFRLQVIDALPNAPIDFDCKRNEAEEREKTHQQKPDCIRKAHESPFNLSPMLRFLTPRIDALTFAGVPYKPFAMELQPGMSIPALNKEANDSH